MDLGDTFSDGRKRLTPPGVAFRTARLHFGVKVSEMVEALAFLGIEVTKKQFKRYERRLDECPEGLDEALNVAFVNVARARRGEAPRPIPSPVSHVVYRVYGVNGRLLYVGCTSNLPQRMANHRAASKWAHRMSSVVAGDEYPDRETALHAERKAIATEHPSFNVKGRSLDRAPWTRQDYLDYIAARQDVEYVPSVGKQLARLRAEMTERFGGVA